MKYIMLLITLVLVGCGGDDTAALKQRVSSLREEVSDLEGKLNSCKSELEYAQPAPLVVQNEPEQPATPSCDKYDFYDVSVDGKYLTSCREATQHECGVKLDYCTDGYSYSCLKNVKYKTIEKEICE